MTDTQQNQREPEMPDIVYGLLTRLRIKGLVKHHNKTFMLALFIFINCCFSIALMAFLALITHSPFVFPSLGATAFLLFYTPTSPSASPRTIIIGQATSIIIGYVSLVVTGLITAEPSIYAGVSWPRVIAASLSLGLTAGIMVLLKAPHPPGAATTLIISLGIITAPRDLLVLFLGVIVLAVQGFVINRFAGIRYPLWGKPQQFSSVAR